MNARILLSTGLAIMGINLAQAEASRPLISAGDALGDRPAVLDPRLRGSKGQVEVVVQFHEEIRMGDFPSRKELTRHCSEAVAGGVDRALGGRLLTAPTDPQKNQL